MVFYTFLQTFVFKRYNIFTWQCICQSDKLGISVSETNYIRLLHSWKTEPNTSYFFSQRFVFKCYLISAWQSVCQSDKFEISVSETRYATCSILYSFETRKALKEKPFFIIFKTRCLSIYRNLYSNTITLLPNKVFANLEELRFL